MWAAVSTTAAAEPLNVFCDLTALPSADALESVLFSALTVTTPSVTSRPVPAEMVMASGISASAFECVTAIPTAPATCTFEPPWPEAELPAVLAFPLPALAALARLLAADFWLVALVSTSPSDEFPSASESPPATLALARALLAPVEWATKATAPPAVRLRAVVATTVSAAIDKANEMPTPVLPDSVSPSAAVSTLPSWVALAENLPSSEEPATSVPSLAFTVFSTYDVANTGVIAVLPAPPPTASVFTSFLDAAESVTSFAPEKSAPSLISASVWSMPTLSANAAPMPNLPASACLPVALTLFSTKFSAVTNRSPPPVIVTVVPAST